VQRIITFRSHSFWNQTKLKLYSEVSVFPEEQKLCDFNLVKSYASVCSDLCNTPTAETATGLSSWMSEEEAESQLPHKSPRILWMQIRWWLFSNQESLEYSAPAIIPNQWEINWRRHLMCHMQSVKRERQDTYFLWAQLTTRLELVCIICIKNFLVNSLAKMSLLIHLKGTNPTNWVQFD